MRSTRNARRPGFTLLEVLLSSAIAIMLMGALYVAVEVQLKHAKVSREVIETSTLARALLSRISSDIKPGLAPPMPVMASTAAGGAGAAAGGAGATTTTDPSAATAGSSTGATTSGTAAAPAAATGTSTSAVVLNIGVQGDASQMTILVSHVPREVVSGDGNNAEAALGVSDLRRITYWLAGGDNPTGLARMEVKTVTAEDATKGPADVNEADYVIAEEVKSLSFQYFDGTDWLDSWDGSVPLEGGTSAKGPPLAIKVTLGIMQQNRPPNEDPIKYFRHVLALPTANGLPSQTTSTATAP